MSEGYKSDVVYLRTHNLLFNSLHEFYHGSQVILEINRLDINVFRLS